MLGWAPSVLDHPITLLKHAFSLVTSLNVCIYSLSFSHISLLLQMKWKFSQIPFPGLPLLSLHSVSLAVSQCQLSHLCWLLFTFSLYFKSITFFCWISIWKFSHQYTSSSVCSLRKTVFDKIFQYIMMSVWWKNQALEEKTGKKLKLEYVWITERVTMEVIFTLWLEGSLEIN